MAVKVSEIRDLILAEPDVILDDRAIMQALISANDQSLGGNIVDLRGVAMARLEHRLDRLEDTHRSVIAAAYDNLAGTNRIHRAVLALMEPVEFSGFLAALKGPVADVLRVDVVRLVLEDSEGGASHAIARLSDVLSVVPEGFIDGYIDKGREGMTPRPVTLRQIQPDAGSGAEHIYGEFAAWVRSEALLRLDFGTGTKRGLLALAGEDPHQFRASQGTDLLGFFGSVFERQMRLWLS